MACLKPGVQDPDGFFEVPPGAGQLPSNDRQPMEEEGLLEGPPAVADPEVVEGLWEDPVIPGLAREDSTLLDAERMLDAPPLRHMNDSAIEGLNNTGGSYEAMLSDGREVCNMFRKNQKKLIVRNLSSAAGQSWHRKTSNFSGHVYPKRWATIMRASVELAIIEHGARKHFDQDKFMEGSKEKDRGTVA